MLPLFHAPAQRRRRGFTLLEFIAVIVIVIVGLGLYMRVPDSNQHRLVQGTAHDLQAAMQAALEQAEQKGEQAVFYVDVTPTAGRYGKFLAISGPPGVDSVGAIGWIEFTTDVQWSTGAATTGPMGDAVGPLPAEIRCSGRNCYLGGSDFVTYYVGHRKNPLSVSAVVLTTEGILQLFRYKPATNTWERGAV